MAEEIKNEKIRPRHQPEHREKVKKTDNSGAQVFEQLVKKSTIAPMSTPQQQSKEAAETAIREAVKKQEDSPKEQKSQEREKTESKEGGDKGKLEGRNTVTHRAVTRNSHQEGNSSGQYSGGGGSDARGGAYSHRKILNKKLEQAGVRSLPMDLKARIGEKVSAQMKPQAGTASNPVLSQQMLDKIIQCVRIGMNQKGQKEIHVELGERMYKGMKLKVVSNEDSIGVHFLTTSEEGRAVLERNKDALSHALKSKNINVEEITVS